MLGESSRKQPNILFSKIRSIGLEIYFGEFNGFNAPETGRSAPLLPFLLARTARLD
jgi:hypothetical protein